MKLKITSPESLSEAIGAIRIFAKSNRFFNITISAGKARTLAQNAQLHAWYNQVSREEGEYTAADIKCLCKLHLFLPILRGDDPEYNAICEKVIDPLPYPDKVEAMKIFPCTSLMNTKQLNEALAAMRQYYVGRVQLEFLG